MLEKFKSSMNDEFDMTDLGRMKYFLGVKFIQDAEGIFIYQRKYAGEILENSICYVEMQPKIHLSQVQGSQRKVKTTKWMQHSTKN